MAATPAWEPRLGASSFESVVDMWHHRIGSTGRETAFHYRLGAAWHEMSWQKAGEISREIALGLLALGVAPEERCGLLSETRVEWILADLGILCAGAATTTLYPASTCDECAHILADSESVVVFCSTWGQVDKVLTLRAQLPNLRRVVVFDGESDGDFVVSLADLRELGRKHEIEYPGAYAARTSAITGEHLAALIYTSGTTGIPKGVMLSHDAWVYEAEAIDALRLMTPVDKQFLFLPLAHVFAKVLEVSTIRLGIPTIVDGDPDQVAKHLLTTKPTFVAAVPRFFEKAHDRILSQVAERGLVAKRSFEWALDIGKRVRALERAGEPVPLRLRARHRLADRLVFRGIREGFGGEIRFFISGGAPLARELAEFFHAFGLLILEGYGLTESSAASCVNRPDSFVFGSVGKPLPGCQVQIADDGEILLRSRGVMRGYHGKPEETAAALTEDGWLRTGDIGHVLPSGHVVITDRKKEIIVTAGGKNIAPAHFANLLKARAPLVEHVLVHGDRRPYCVALIGLDLTAALRFAKERDLPQSLVALARHPDLLDAIQRDIDAVNRTLPSFETIKRFAVLPEVISVESGLLTPSQKVKRGEVESRYADVLETLYA
ncbi:MAG: long-chain fatty acid--CoA ligase [Deltaproteobacteria bacterium]|nr:MAG: long-chain fatty acid--CoA ligase [Deltaproteobacteria bacterium]